MPVPTFTGLPPYPEFSDVTAKINKLVQELQNLMLSLDDANFDKITANVMDVQELSAITANLGTITAGLLVAVNVIGSYIATANGSYPRCEMSSTNNLFAAYKDANDHISMVPTHLGGPPAFVGYVDGNEAYALTASPTAVVLNIGGRDFIITTTAQGNVDLMPELGYFVRVPSWNALMNSGSGVDLASELAGISASITALTTALSGKATSGSSTGSAGPYNGGIPIGTNLVTTTGTVTWSGIPAHSHSQT